MGELAPRRPDLPVKALSADGGSEEASKRSAHDALPSLRYAGREVCLASLEAVSYGIRRHVPDGVGVAMYSAIVCTFATYMHFVLDAPTWLSPLGGGAAAALIATWRVFGRRAS